MKLTRTGERGRHKTSRSGDRPLAHSANRHHLEGHPDGLLANADSATRARVVAGLQSSVGNTSVQRVAPTRGEKSVQRKPQNGDPVVQRAPDTDITVEADMVTNPIKALSYNLGAARGTVPDKEGKPTPGAMKMTALTFEKAVDGSSVGLFKALSESKPIPKVEVAVSEAEESKSAPGKKAAGFGYVLQNARVANVQHGGDTTPKEEKQKGAREVVAIEFEKMEMKSPGAGGEEKSYEAAHGPAAKY